MKPPAFDPPYDSPIEEAFAWDLVKHLTREVEFTKQVECKTPAGDFRLDFTASLNGRTIGIECDGKEYHGTVRDVWRDAAILAACEVEAIYRFRGQDIWHRINDCMFLTCRFEPLLFRPGKFSGLRVPASDECRACVDAWNENANELSIFIQLQHGRSLLYVARNSVRVPVIKKYIRFMFNNPGKTLDQIIELYDQSH